MKNILYLMTVNWGWIKQRPHFLAEELASYYEVNAFFLKHYKKYRNAEPVRNDVSNLRLHEIFRLPLDERIGIIKKINFSLMRSRLRKASLRSDIIWYSKPEHVEWLPLLSGRINVYDCMDDMLSFPSVKNNPVLFNRTYFQEKKLIDSCEVIIASSSNLAEKLKSRYKVSRMIHVVNNAVNLYDKIDRYDDPVFEELEKKGKKILTYVGTIAEWFDFDSLIRSLGEARNTVLVLFGPSTVQIPVHPSVIHLGTVTHNLVPDIIQRSDALILPFVVDELIKAVNPVKLYEYIFSGNNVISCKYGETEKFSGLVHLYDTTDELIELIAQLDKGLLKPVAGKEECIRFAKENTWKARAVQLKNILENV